MKIAVPILTFETDIREDANSHKVTQCKYPSRRLCTAFDLSSHLFLDALLPLGVGGSEDGAVFGVDFARS